MDTTVDATVEPNPTAQVDPEFAARIAASRAASRAARRTATWLYILGFGSGGLALWLGQIGLLGVAFFLLVWAWQASAAANRNDDFDDHDATKLTAQEASATSPTGCGLAITLFVAVFVLLAFLSVLPAAP